MMLLYSSPELYAVFHPGDSDFLLITFGYNGMRADDASFWGQGLCNKARINAVGFVSRSSNWFPQKHVGAALEQVLPQIKQFGQRITYGGSMGGWAALKYSKSLDADAALAFSPQFSIDPKVVGDFENKYTEFYEPGLNDDMAPDGERDVCGRPYVLVDPTHAGDARHVSLIKLSAPQTTIIPMPRTGHAVAGVFANTSKATRLISAALSGDLEVLRRTASAERRASSIRSTLVSLAALDRHPVWGMRLGLKHAGTFEPHDWNGFQNRVMRIAAQQAGAVSPDAACSPLAQAATAVLAMKTADGYGTLREAARAAAAGRLEDAILKAQEVCCAMPRFAEAPIRLSVWLMEAGRLDEAAEAANRAADLDPDTASNHQRVAVIEGRRSNFTKAADAARRAVSCAPKDVRLRDMLAGLLQKAGRDREAYEEVRKAVLIDPSYPLAQSRLSHLASRFADHEAALAAAERVVALRGPTVPDLKTLAMRRHSAGDVQGAAEAITQALSLMPDEREAERLHDLHSRFSVARRTAGSENRADLRHFAHAVE
ncbi:hypothetical protein [Roseomonas sp. BN140053]|uniref:hypothetical protein n=1 Tax=Roseomonas sp. BN140053 TaxID=3391898 RepID=UPI0039EC3279